MNRLDKTKEEREQGVVRKYNVVRLDDKFGKHDTCDYFVLDPQHDRHAIPALRAYAESAREDRYIALANELEAWANRAAAATHKAVFQAVTNSTSAPDFCANCGVVITRERADRYSLCEGCDDTQTHE